jgi:hypothetical protein
MHTLIYIYYTHNHPQLSFVITCIRLIPKTTEKLCLFLCFIHGSLFGVILLGFTVG